MPKRAKTIDWDRIQIEYLAGEDSIREIADRHEISDTAIRKRAKAGGWIRPVRSSQRREPIRQGPPPPAIGPTTPIDPGTLADKTRGLVNRMLDELDTVTSHRDELEDIIVAATERDDNDAKRDAMMKAVSLPVRSGTLKTLAAALKTVNEVAAPQGKKAAAQERAGSIATGRFAPRSPPKLVVDNR